MLNSPKIKFAVNLNLNFESESGLASLQEIFEKKKAEIESKTEEAVTQLGEMTQELMVSNIEANGSVKTGAFVNSITMIQEGLMFEVGSTLGTIVPKVIEEGRGSVFPKNVRCLHYVDDGKEYFVKSVSGYEGAPYVAPTAEAISNVARDVILNKISEV